MSPRTRKPSPSAHEVIRACLGEASNLSDPRKLRGAGTRCRNQLVKAGADRDLAERVAGASLSVAHAVRMAEQRARMRLRRMFMVHRYQAGGIFDDAP